MLYGGLCAWHVVKTLLDANHLATWMVVAFNSFSYCFVLLRLCAYEIYAKHVREGRGRCGTDCVLLRVVCCRGRFKVVSVICCLISSNGPTTN